LNQNTSQDLACKKVAEGKISEESKLRVAIWLKIEKNGIEAERSNDTQNKVVLHWVSNFHGISNFHATWNICQVWHEQGKHQ
jgi:hypothetical protein